MIEALVERGCDIDHPDQAQNTALHWAVVSQNFLVVKTILKYRPGKKKKRVSLAPVRC
jgi:ankyrin repeat protein